jgi:hypothetical protein
MWVYSTTNVYTSIVMYIKVSPLYINIKHCKASDFSLYLLHEFGKIKTNYN